jgi:diacylglycerol kinase (ATP)
MSRFLTVVNPIAGRGNGAQSVPAVRAALTRLGVEFEMVQTERPGHAVEIAQQAASEDYEVMVAVGGDGTVNEVVNGLVRAAGDGPTTVPLGVVPVGSGNDFAYMALGRDLDIEAACQRVVKGQDKLADLATVMADGQGFRYFANGMGVGFDAQVSIEARRVKVLRGFLMYLWAVLRTIFLHYHPVPVTVTCDARSYTQSLLMVNIAVGRRLGGGFLVTPFAVADDGLLDVCIAGDVSRPAIFPLIPRFMNGSHATHPKVTMTQGHTVTVSSPEGLAAHVDGEVYTTSAKLFEMKSLPARLWVRC